MAGTRGENRLWIAWFAGVAGAVALVVSQFMDYTGFEIGSGGTESANEVAPRPIQFTEMVGPDQLWLGLLLGLGALAALYLVARRGQWRLGRTVTAIGALMLIASLVILLPNATDGSAGIDGAPAEIGLAYAGVDEKLMAGFWVQLLAALTLVGSGIAMVRGRAGA